jgi:hypothetical protein
MFPHPTNRRVWFIPDFSVYGLPGLGPADYLVAETVGGTTSVFLASSDIAGSRQEVLFANLTDHRGNRLPATIDSPRVIPRPRQETQVFVVGREANDRFTIAHDPAVGSAVPADLLILELGS